MSVSSFSPDSCDVSMWLEGRSRGRCVEDLVSSQVLATTREDGGEVSAIKLFCIVLSQPHYVLCSSSEQDETCSSFIFRLDETFV